MVRTATDAVDPAVPLAFLHKVVSVLQDYLVGSTDPALLTEELVCEHFDIVYELLEEMLDGEGNVLMTEVNSLKDIVLPPSWLDKLVKTVGLNSYAKPLITDPRSARAPLLPRPSHGGVRRPNTQKMRCTWTSSKSSRAWCTATAHP